MVIAFFVFMESVARLVDPPDIDTNMLTVSFFLLFQCSFAVNRSFIFYLQGDSPSSTWREPSGELERNFLPGHLVDKGKWPQTEAGQV